MDPERIRIIAEGDGCAHREHIGIHGHGEEHGGENREHLHGEVELVREKGIVRRLQCLDGFFATLQDIPNADIRPDEILKIHLQIIRHERVLMRDEGFEYGSLRLQRSTEIEDISLGDGDLVHHLLFLLSEYLTLDEVEFLRDMIETGEAGVEQNLENGIEEMRGSFLQVNTPFALALPKFIEKPFQLIDGLLVPGDEVILGKDDIELTRISGTVFYIEEGRMHREEETVIILHDFRLIGWRHEFFYRERMHIKILLQIEDIVFFRVFEINPSE